MIVIVAVVPAVEVFEVVMEYRVGIRTSYKTVLLT